jgi:hypothetical protein
MGRSVLLAMTILIAPNVHAQDFVSSQPAGKQGNMFTAITSGLAIETQATAQELLPFRDPKWSALTIVQIAAATADAETSLHNFNHCATCLEIGVSKLVVGQRPEAHKYAIAGLIEISVEAVASHYLRNHGPIRKWYWRYVWALPQSISLCGHTRADFHNIGVKMRCDNMCLNCY